MKRVLRGVARLSGGEVVVQRESLARHLGDAVRRRYDGLHAPLIVFYHVLFALMLLGHEQLADLSQADRELRDILSGSSFEGYAPTPVSGHKNLMNIDAEADVYLYLREAVLPMFLPTLNSTPHEDLRRTLRYNQLVGGLVLQQTRRPKRACSEAYPSLGPFDENGTNPLLESISCFPQAERTGECFGPGAAMEGFCPDSVQGHARRLRPKKMAREPKLAAGAWQIVDSVDGEKFSVVFNEHDGLQEGRRRLQLVRDHHWIDEQTCWLGIQVFVFNPDLGVCASAVVNIFFLQSGELLPIVQVFSFLVQPLQYKSLLVLDGVWLLLWFLLLTYCTWSLFWACCSSDRRSEHLLSAWTWVGWLTVIMGALVIIQGMSYLERLDLLGDAAMSVAFDRPAAAGGSPQMLQAYKGAVQRLHADLTEFEDFLTFLHRYVGFYSILIMFRLFKAFDVAPRLAVVMDTLAASLTDVLHFMLVVFTVNTAFVLSGIFLFGHRVIKFSRFDMAYEACLLLLFGNMDYEELASEHPQAAFLWFFTFVAIMYMVILNMALAIFMDVYAGMKNKSDLSDTVIQQLLGVYASIRRWRSEVSATTLLQSVDKLDIPTVNMPVLMEACPGLGEEQARKLLGKVEAAEDFEDEDTLTLSDAFRVVASIPESIKSVKKQVDFLLLTQKRSRFPTHSHGAGGSQLHPDADRQLSSLEGRSAALEEFLNEVMSYVVLRGKEARDRLEAMEDHLRSKAGAGPGGVGPRISASPGGGGGSRAVSPQQSSPPLPVLRDRPPSNFHS